MYKMKLIYRIPHNQSNQYATDPSEQNEPKKTSKHEHRQWFGTLHIAAHLATGAGWVVVVRIVVVEGHNS